MFSITVVSILLTFVVACAGQSICKSPQPAKDFDYTEYTGLWYEIGKIQTPGGAKWQANCVCTLSESGPSKRPNSEPSDARITYACRDKTPTGRWTNVTASLHDMDPENPGIWIETFFPGIPSMSYDVDYFVIDIDDMGQEFAVEYDCDETDYCVHFFSRRPTIDRDMLRTLVDEAVRMGLNPLNLPFKATNHDGCWPQK